MTNYRGLMAENTGCVVNCLVFLVTMFGNNIFTLFNLSSANNNLVFFMTHLFMMTFLLMHDIIVQSTLNILVARRKFSEGKNPMGNNSMSMCSMGNNSMGVCSMVMWSSKKCSRRKCLCCTGQKKKSTESDHNDDDRDSSHLFC